MRVFSFGGGVQSHAALALTQQGILDYDAFLFCNVGDKAENPATLRYVEDVTIPFCERHGIPFHVLRRVRQRDQRDGRPGRRGDLMDLYDIITDETISSINIPVRMAGGMPGRRNCTQDFKIEVVDRWCKEHGATPDNPFTVGIGISLDEIGRARSDQPNPTQVREYPLIRARVTRERCREINEAAGFHDVPRSSCWFCPMKKAGEWREQYEDHPDLFARSVELEAILNRKRAARGRDDVYLAATKGRGVPLPVLARTYLPDDDHDACDSGHCFI